MSVRVGGGTLTRMTEGVGIALDSIRASKVRAFLTILGVAIGVMVVIAMGSAITGINRSVTTMLESAGPKTFFVFRFFQGGLDVSDGSDELSPWRTNPWLSVAEAELIRRQPSIRDVAVQEQSSGPVSYNSTKLSSVNVEGNGAAWVVVSGGEMRAGRSFTPVEYASGAHVVVINQNLADALFPGLDPIGKRIKVFGQYFEVIGVHLEAASLFGGGKNPVAIIPHSTFTKVADYWKGWMQIVVLPTETATVSEAQDEVTSALRSARGLKPGEANNFSIVTQDKFLDSFNNITRGFFFVMIALSSVGLMVGGVGVVAIMMISVTERTREIGVRKALGATRREIMFQFLIEAATMTLVGCIVGMLMGAGIAAAIRGLTPIPASVPLMSVVAAVVASTFTGVLFGLYPANKASKMDPVEALRYE
ncbi:MAG: ABC transporter permease [Gemmatimonadales bacterium]|nr:ABC transporter permease [Gemmatimonadales bacterium]